MFDINFYMKTYERIKNGDIDLDFFENCRDKNPRVYNLEPTNDCPMRCQMCPRTTMMTRKIKYFKKENFINAVNQIKPHSKKDWNNWKVFCEDKFGIYENDVPSENHFFLYIIPNIIQLHAYGESLLDKNMPEYIKILSEKGFKSYFSCNPANINIKKTEEMFANGLDYIKYSIESTNDQEHKRIRGDASNFTKGYKKIKKLLDIKEKNNYNIKIVVTMLDLNRTNQKEDFNKLKDAFRGCDVYLYLKSEDQQWYREDFHGTKSIHWSRPCLHPWMSMSINAGGEVVACMEDFNSELILGDIKKDSLSDIWNGQKYKEFRERHFNLKDKKFKCFARCDMKLVGNV